MATGGIGYHSRKYMAEKEAKAMAQDRPNEPDVVEEVKTAQVYEKAGIAPPAPTTTDANLISAMMQGFKDIIAQMQSAKTDEEKADAAKQADLMEQLLVKTKPENVTPPLVSEYSFPEGETKNPKPDLKCKMFWVGYDLKTDTLTPEEVNLLNRLEPGTFRITKADGHKIPFTVTATRDSNLKLETLSVQFPCKGQDRHNHGSMISYCMQALGLNVQLSNDEMRHELNRLRVENAQLKGAAA